MRIAVMLAILTLVSCGAPEQEAPEVDSSALNTKVSGTSDFADPVAECIARGVAYFKEIGSYPTLTSAPNAGRSAEDVASERCNRTATAF